MIGPVLDALFTPPFLADRRIVVLRDAERLDASQAGELASRLSEPFAPNVLVLAAVGKALPAALAKAVKARGPGDRHIGRFRQGAHAVAERAVAGGAGPPRPGRPPPARGPSRRGCLAPACALGHSGRLPTAKAAGCPRLNWSRFSAKRAGRPRGSSTDALDAGDAAKAVQAARRLLGAGGRHPFQLLATLHKHYGSMLRLDGSGVTDPDEAAIAARHVTVSGAQGAHAGNKAWFGTRRRAVSLVADADHDLRGVVDWPDELVIEVLVARLAQLSRARSASPTGSRRPARTS